MRCLPNCLRAHLCEHRKHTIGKPGCCRCPVHTVHRKPAHHPSRRVLPDPEAGMKASPSTGGPVSTLSPGPGSWLHDLLAMKMSTQLAASCSCARRQIRRARHFPGGLKQYGIIHPKSMAASNTKRTVQTVKKAPVRYYNIASDAVFRLTTRLPRPLR